MSFASVLVVAAAVAAIATLASGLRRRARGRGSVQVRRISVNGSYHPAVVHVEAGRPVRLMFRRDSITECAEYVVFPDFGISAMLPPHQDVPVDLPPCSPGEHVFACKLDVFRGRLVVDDPGYQKEQS